MPRLVFIGMAALLSVAAQAQQPRSMALHCPQMWNGSAETLENNVFIVISGERIESVVHNAPINAEIFEAQGVCMPGLIDVHTHVFLQQDELSLDYDSQLLKESIPYRTIRAVRSAELALEHGFTTIRDVETEGAGYADVDLKKAIQQAIIPGPTMQVAGRALDVTGAYPLEGYAPEIQPKLPHGVQVVDGIESARKAVREQISYGVDWIKIYADRDVQVSGNELHGIPTFTLDEMKAMVDEAHRERRRVASHAQSPEGVENALAAGVDSIEHGIYMTDQQIAAMKKQGVVYVPTLFDVRYSAERRKSERLEKMYEIGRNTLLRAMRAELKIAFGTDIGGFDWRISAAKQMQLFVEIGMSPRQAILTSIKNGAELMHLEGEIGTLQAGKFADIIVVSGNPLEDITALQRVQLTMHHGSVFRSSSTERSATVTSPGHPQ